MQAWATREAPAQAELRPTCAGAFLDIASDVSRLPKLRK
jgi:hypothetical protein